MPHSWNDPEREGLERDLERSDYSGLLHRINEDQLQHEFSSWQGVIAFIRDGSNDDVIDSILSSVISAYQQGLDSKPGTVLLVIFWPGLKGIKARKRKWDRDSEEFWQNILDCFMESAWKLNLQGRRSGLIRKVLNDTFHRLYEKYSKIWITTRPEVNVDLDELETIMGTNDVIEAAEAEQRIDEGFQAKLLRGRMQAAGLKEVDFKLVVETRLHCIPLEKCAAQLGITYQAAKKRRQRAEARLRRKLSPKPGYHPPISI